jgi:hypothetical protein
MKINSFLVAFMLTGIISAKAGVVSKLEVNENQLEVNKELILTLKFADSPSAIACGLSIDWGDGKIERFRVGEGQQIPPPYKINHLYSLPNKYKVRINGELLVRGLRSVPACDVKQEGTITVYDPVEMAKRAQEKAEAEKEQRARNEAEAIVRKEREENARVAAIAKAAKDAEERAKQSAPAPSAPPPAATTVAPPAGPPPLDGTKWSLYHSKCESAAARGAAIAFRFNNLYIGEISKTQVAVRGKGKAVCTDGVITGKSEESDYTNVAFEDGAIFCRQYSDDSRLAVERVSRTLYKIMGDFSEFRGNSLILKNCSIERR